MTWSPQVFGIAAGTRKEEVHGHHEHHGHLHHTKKKPVNDLAWLDEDIDGGGQNENVDNEATIGMEAEAEARDAREGEADPVAPIRDEPALPPGLTGVWTSEDVL